MLSKGAMITRASAMEFRIPSATRRRANPYDHNVIVRLDAAVPAGSIQAAGEAAPRHPVSDSDAEEAWRFLENALDQIEGVRVPTDSVQARAQVADLLAGLDGRGGRPTPEYRGAHRAVLAGLDGALVDLAARSAGIPLAAFLGGRRRPVAAVGIVRAHQPEDVMRRQLRTCSRCAAVKVIGVSDADAALDAASIVAAETGPGMPVWVEPADPLALSEARTLVQAVAEQMATGTFPPHLVLQLPCSGVAGHADLTDLGELQAAADRLVPPGTSTAGIVLMVDVSSADEARAAAAAGVRGVHLNPQRLGGTLATLSVAEKLSRPPEELRLGLSTVPEASDVAARVLVELAAALPRLDYCAVWPTTTGGPATLDPALTFDDESQVVPGRGPGLGGELALAPVVHHLTRYAQGAREAGHPPRHEGRAVNRFDIGPLMPFINARGGMYMASPMLERAALRLGLNTVRFDREYFMADHPDLITPIGFKPNTTMWTGVAIHQVTHDKQLTREILQAAGVPVPQGASFGPGEIEEAVTYAASLPSPVVVKPRLGTHGVGVSTDLRSDDDVRSAIATLQRTKFNREPFIVEEYVPGDDYRLLVVGDRVVSVVLKRPASVVGDGRSTVVDLVLQKNRWRLEHPHGRGGLVEFGRDASFWLGKQELTADTVPEEGRVVRLGSAGNISAGGESIEVLDETHESLIDLAIRTVHAFPGMDHCGLDIMGDHRVGLDRHRAGLIDVNTGPATSFNHFPMFGTPRDVSVDIVLRSCALSGFEPLDRPSDDLAVRIEVEGRVRGVGYRRWFAAQARTLGVVGTVRNVASAGVEAHVAGRAVAVATLASSAISGPPNATVTRVTTSHVSDVQPSQRFEVAE